MKSLIYFFLLPFSFAAFTKLGGVYEPNSIMTDESAMDLDQNAIVYHLLLKNDDGFEIARKVYDNGAYTNNFAVLKLKGSNIPSGGIASGTTVSGHSTAGIVIKGEAYDDMEAGELILKFKYPIYDMKPPNHVGCIVGSLPNAWQTQVGCLKESGVVAIDGIGAVNYTYSVQDDNKSGRSFKGWSTTAQSTMGSCGADCPYSDFLKFKKYYGQSAYADEWISAALEGRATNYPGGKGNADFSVYGFEGRTQAVMKGTAYITDPMMTIRQLEYASSICKTSATAAVHAWDVGVAYYTGSWALGAPGVLMYTLAEKRCKNFKTCGREANKLEGTSYVNLQMNDIFTLGQYRLDKSDCDKMRGLIDRAVALMTIPVIQGTLRYAYKVGMGADTSEKAMAEGAVFAAGVLPRVHACNEADASTIFENMKVGAPSTDFYAVLSAFENNYECMGIGDWEVGALYDEELNGGQGGNMYTPKYQAVGARSTASAGSATNMVIIGVAVGVAIFILILVVFVASRQRKKKQPPIFVNSENDPV